MAAPTFVQEAETVWNTTAQKTTASFSVLAGDVLVAFNIVESWGGTAGTMDVTIAGGSLSWGTALQNIEVDSYTSMTIWAATVDANKSMTVAFTSDENPVWWGGNVFTFRDSDGVGASSKTNVSSGAPSLSLTTTQANSAIVVVNGDWAAVDGASRTWRTVNSVTPTAANGMERSYFHDAARYSLYGAYYTDVGATGAKTVGLSAPSGQKYSIVAVEVKGSTGGGAPALHTLALVGVGQ